MAMEFISAHPSSLLDALERRSSSPLIPTTCENMPMASSKCFSTKKIRLLDAAPCCEKSDAEMPLMPYGLRVCIDQRATTFVADRPPSQRRLASPAATVPRTPSPEASRDAAVPVFLPLGGSPAAPAAAALRPAFYAPDGALASPDSRLARRRPRRSESPAAGTVPALALPPPANFGKRGAPFIEESAAHLLEVDVDSPRRPPGSLLLLAKACPRRLVDA